MSAAGKRVVLLCGGASEEHEVSLASARSVLEAVGGRFTLEPVVLDRQGCVLEAAVARRALGLPESTGTRLATRSAASRVGGNGSLTLALRPGDVVFPLLHGPFGEDGRVQGLLEVMGVDYVGSGVLASAVGMDKLTMKAVLGAHGLPQVAYRGLSAPEYRRDPQAAFATLEPIGWPRFVKPANLGSSIGIARVDDEEGLRSATEAAFGFDRRVIVEEAVVGARELEVAVLGNDEPELSPVGEVRYQASFYDFETKYTEGRAELRIPAELPDGVTAAAQGLARRAFQAIDAAGLARVDLFFDEDSGRLYVNEINTMPGFTATSMYPKLWEAAGLPYAELVERLIALARQRGPGPPPRRAV